MLESSVMFPVNFKRIRAQCRKLDDGISKLTETWKNPSMLVGGYAKYCDETIAYTEEIRTALDNTKGDIERTLTNKEASSENEEDFETILQESRAAYEDLNSECEDLHTVFQEYGYHYEDNNSSSCSSNILEVEFTPKLSWKYKAKQDNQLNLNKTTLTPVNRNLASVMGMDTPSKAKLTGTYTPGRNRPQAPIYSTHFYDIPKKL